MISNLKILFCFLRSPDAAPCRGTGCSGLLHHSDSSSPEVGRLRSPHYRHPSHMKSKPKTSCEAGNRFKVCMWGRWCSRAPPVSHQHRVFLRNLLSSFTAVGRTVPGPLGQQAKSPMCNNLWRSQASYLWCSGGTPLNGDLHIWEWKNLPGYLYFGR